MTSNRMRLTIATCVASSAMPQNGYEVQSERFFRTPFRRRFIDIDVNQNGENLGGIECKVWKLTLHHISTPEGHVARLEIRLMWSPYFEINEDILKNCLILWCDIWRRPKRGGL